MATPAGMPDVWSTYLATDDVKRTLDDAKTHGGQVILDAMPFADLGVMGFLSDPSGGHDVERLQVTGDWEQAARLLAAAGQSLERGGADLLILCTNTMHKVAAEVQAAVDIPLLHLGDVTAAAVLEAGISTVGLLGTAFTMEQDFYRDRLASHGLRVLVPGAADRDLVHRVIYEELCVGIVRETSRVAYQSVMGRLADAGAAGIILGCTEIELLLREGDCPVPAFPTTRIHAHAAVRHALGQAPGDV